VEILLVVDLLRSMLCPEHGPYNQAETERDGTCEQGVAVSPIREDAFGDLGRDKVVDNERKREECAGYEEVGGQLECHPQPSSVCPP